MMSKRQRVEAVLRGQRPDRPPVSFWHHFPPTQIRGPAAIDAHLGHCERFDLDFLKVMDDHHFPRGELEVVASAADLRKIQPLPGDAGDFADQLEVLRQLRRRLGEDVLMCTTVFNAWAMLRRLVGPPVDEHGPPRLDGQDQRDRAITALLKEDRAAVKAALEHVAETLAAFARAAVQVGASGIFLSVRDDWVDTPANGPGTYAELVQPTDLRILSAVADAPFNMLHVCGRALNFRAFTEYPVAVLNWADRYAGPSLAEVRDWAKPALAGGVDNLNTLPRGTPGEVAAEVADALRQAGPRPIMIAPGCTYDPQSVPVENLRALATAARSAG